MRKSILMRILERSPLGSVVVEYAGVFDPKKLFNDDCDCEELSQQFKRLLSQLQEFLQSECKSDLFRLESFNCKENRLDELFFHSLGIQKYKDQARSGVCRAGV